MSEIMVKYENILVMGDFNVHVNDLMDTNGDDLNSLLVVMGLQQRVHFATHNKGNTLDLVLTETDAQMEITNVHPGDFISDHRLITGCINLPKPKIEQKCLTYRKTKDLDMEQLVNSMNLEEITYSDNNNIDALWELFEDNIKKGLDLHAPEKTTKIRIRKSLPWYNDALREQKKISRNRGKNLEKIQVGTSMVCVQSGEIKIL